MKWVKDGLEIREDESGRLVATVYNGKEDLISTAPELLEIAKAYRNLLKTSAHTEGEVRTFHHIEDVIKRAENK